MHQYVQKIVFIACSIAASTCFGSNQTVSFACSLSPITTMGSSSDDDSDDSFKAMVGALENFSNATVCKHPKTKKASLVMPYTGHPLDFESISDGAASKQKWWSAEDEKEMQREFNNCNSVQRGTEHVEIKPFTTAEGNSIYTKIVLPAMRWVECINNYLKIESGIPIRYHCILFTNPIQLLWPVLFSDELCQNDYSVIDENLFAQNDTEKINYLAEVIASKNIMSHNLALLLLDLRYTTLNKDIIFNFIEYLFSNFQTMFLDKLILKNEFLLLPSNEKELLICHIESILMGLTHQVRMVLDILQKKFFMSCRIEQKVKFKIYYALESIMNWLLESNIVNEEQRALFSQRVYSWAPRMLGIEPKTDVLSGKKVDFADPIFSFKQYQKKNELPRRGFSKRK